MGVALHSPLLDETRTLLHMYETDVPHVQHVASLAFDMFSHTRSLHKSPPHEASLLYCAALLHDVGWSISDNGSKHHKLSAQLIRNHPWKLLDETEKQIVALVARYHRRKIPAPHHHFFKDLHHTDQERVRTLASFIRIADALDRTHRQAITIREIQKVAGSWVIVIDSSKECHEESRVFSLKKDLFEAHFQVSLLLKIN